MSGDVAELQRAADGVLDDWCEVAVADVVAMLPGFAFKSENFVTDTDAGLPLIRIRDLGLTNTATRYVGDYDEAFAVRDGDILVGMDGSFEAVRWQGGKALLNQRVLKLSSARPDAIDEGYLFYRVQPALSELEQTISGTTVKHLSTKDLKRLTWQLPPLDEQRRIAEVLRSVDEAIAAAERVVSQAEHSLKLNAEKLLVHDLAGEANECRLVDVIASLDAGVSVNSEGRPAANGEIGILKTSCVSAGHFDPGENKVVRQDEVNRTRVQPTANSIIISRMNTLDLVGANAFVGVNCPNLYLPDRLWLLKTKPSVVCRWLAFYMKTARFRAQIIDIASGTSGSMKNISKGRLADLVLHVPPYRQQERDVEALVAMETAILPSMAIVRSYREVRQVIMSDLLSGRVRVPA